MKQINFILSLTIIVFVFSYSNVRGQSFSWAAGFPNSGFGSFFCDSNNNIISAGGFTAPVDVDPSANTYLLSPVGNYDWFLSKVSSSGSLIWAKHFDGTTNPAGLVLPMGFAKDNVENIYIVGYIKDSFDFDPGPGTFYLPPSTTNYHSGFILKLNANGDFVWAKELEANVLNSNVNLSDIKVNGCSIYITGSFLGTIDVDPSSTAVLNLTAGNPGSGLIEKLDTAGNFQWAKQINGAGFEFLELDSSSNIYCASIFHGIVDFDPGVGVYNMNGGSGSGFAFCFEKLDSLGNFIWAKQIGTGVNNEHLYGITLDRKNNILVTGYFGNTLDFDPGPAVQNLTTGTIGFFLLKLNSNGNYVWANTFNATDGRDVTTDSFGNVYAVGESGGDVFIQKLDSLGNLIWLETFGSSGFDIPGHVCLDHLNNIIITGSIGLGGMGGVGDFDPGLGVFMLGGTNVGFIEKLCVSPPALNISAQNDTICIGDIAVLSVESIQGATYIWGKDGSPLNNSNNDTLLVTQPGDYTVNVYGVGCPYGSDTVHVSVFPVITPTIQITSSPFSVPTGQQVTVHATVGATGGYPYTIYWYNHGVLFATTNTDVVTYVKPIGKDSLSAVIKVNTPCTSPVTSNLIFVTGIGNKLAQDNFSISPNPASAKVYIQSQRLGNLEITDVMGRVVLQQPIVNTQTTVDLNSLSDGLYIYRFFANDGTLIQDKLLLMR